MATKVKKGKYRTQVFIGMVDGKRKYKSFYAATAAEADYLALQYELDKKEKSDPGKITVGEAIDRYLNSISELVSPTSIAGYRSKRRNNFKELMGMRVADVTDVILQEAVNNERKKYSAKTVRDAYSVLKCGILFVHKDFSPKVKLPKKVKKKYNIPNEANLKKILLASQGTRLEIPVLLASWLSLRASEVIGLKWENVYEDHILIETARVYAEGKIHEKETKNTHSYRRIPLPKHIKAVLDNCERSTEFVVNMSGSALYKAFIRMLEKNGIPHYRFHDLRHANASVMVKLKVPDRYAQTRGGWAEGAALTHVYQHTFEEDELEIAECIDSYFDTLVQPQMQPQESETP